MLKEFTEHWKFKIEELATSPYPITVESSTRAKHIMRKQAIIKRLLKRYNLTGYFVTSYYCETCHEYNSKYPIHIEVLRKE